VVNYKIWRDASRDITDEKEFGTSRYNVPTMRKCWDFLDHTSRSFSMVIKELEGDLARVVSTHIVLISYSMG
jgi:farnesyl-diphosphate farnesyltransferase